MSERGTGLSARLRRIRLVVLDVDGVLTDGRIIYDDRGRELKCFDVRDGFGMKRAMSHGLQFAIISGRNSRVTTRRAKELGVGDVVQGRQDKLAVYRELRSKYGIDDRETCFIGDDDLDIPVMRAAGLSAAPSDAMDEVRKIADIVTRRAGGRGVVREVVDAILRAQHRI